MNILFNSLAPTCFLISRVVYSNFSLIPSAMKVVDAEKDLHKILLRKAPVAIVSTDFDNAIVFINEKAETLFGCNDRQVTGNVIFNLLFKNYILSPELKISLLNANALAGARLQSRYPKNDQHTWIEIALQVLEDEQIYQYVFNDVSHLVIECETWLAVSRTQEEEMMSSVRSLTRELKQKEATLIEAQKQSKSGNWSFDLIANKIIWSEGLFYVHGLEMVPLLDPTEVFQLIHPDDREDHRLGIMNIISGRTESYEFIYRIIRPDGEIRYLKSVVNIAKDQDAKPLNLYGSAVDVTEFVLVEERLRESESRFRAIAEALPAPLTISEAKSSRILYANIACGETFGFNSNNLDGQYLTNYYKNILDRKRLKAEFEQVGFVRGFEVEALRLSGETLWVSTSLNRVNYKGIDCYLTVFFDITSRKTAEEKLVQSETALSEAQELTHIGNFEYDLKTKKSVWSKEALKILGLEGQADADIRKITRNSVHPDDMPSLVTIMRNALESRQVFYAEYRLTRQDGICCHLRGIGRYVYDAQGNPIKLFGTVLDITESIRAQARLMESEEKYRLISENITDLVCLHLPDGPYTYVSPSSLAFLGYYPDEMMHHNPFDFYHPDDVEPIRYGSYTRLLGGTGGIVTEYRLRRKSGEYFWVETVSTPFFQNDSFIAMQTVTRNIAERKAAEEEVRRALEKEKELSELKSHFVSMASHQFLTPLTSILSSVEILEMINKPTDDVLASKSAKHYNRIKSEISRLTGLMNHILISGKLEAGKINFKPEKINLLAFSKQVIEQSFSTYIDGRSVDFSYRGKPQKMMADPHLLSHVFSNLLSNAFKYSKGKGNPAFDLEFCSTYVVISFTDQGIGIPQEEQKGLFQSFFRARNTENIQGTGLGLMIVREFVGMHQGEIEVQSEEGQGCTIKILLPFTQ